MPWIKVDDHYNEHPKLAAVGPLGQALWLAGLAYCNRNLTDGFIPWSVAGRLVSWDYLDIAGPTRVYIGTRDRVDEDGLVTSEYVIALLVDGGVWDEAAGGYRVHDYADYQPTKAQVLADRAAKQAAGQAGGRASAQARGQAPAVAPTQAESKPVPVPVSVPQNVLKNVDGGSRAKPSNPLREQMRAAIEARYPDDTTPIVPEPTKPLTAIEREREAHRHEANALHERFKRGELTEPQYERLRADIGKEPDDLTRADPHSEVSA